MAAGDSDKKTRSLEIIQAAREVFIKYGYKKTTVEDIAERLGMVKSSLYYYYRNKQELFGKVMEFEFERFLQAVNEGVRVAASTEKRLRIFSDLSLRFKLEFNQLYNLTIDDIYQNYGRLMEIRSRFIQTVIDVLKDILALDKTLCTRKNHAVLARVFIFSIGGILHRQWEETRYSVGDELNTFVTLFCRGILK